MNKLVTSLKKIFTLRNLAFLVGLSILCFMITKIGVHNIFDNLRQTGWWFFAIIGVWGIGYILNALDRKSVV